MYNENKISIRDMAYIAMFAAVMAVMSQLSLPLPGGVPVTLQTFGAALTGYMLGAKRGAWAVIVYVLLGAAGVPVFAGFHGGLGSVLGQLGGFIWGFIPMAFLCGLGADIAGRRGFCKPLGEGCENASRRHILCNIAPAVALGLLGLAVCHLCGVVQWTAVKGGGIFGSFLVVSAPFLLKDAVSTAAAYFVSAAVVKRVGTVKA